VGWKYELEKRKKEGEGITKNNSGLTWPGEWDKQEAKRELSLLQGVLKGK
jgi:hypothetical protein